MTEIHNISEGSIVEVTEVYTSPHEDEIIPNLQEGVLLEVANVKETPGYGKKVIVKFNYLEDDIPSYKCVISATYESWPNGCSHGLKFDADGYITKFKDKYFDIKEVK